MSEEFSFTNHEINSFEFTVGGKTGLMSNPSESGIFLASMWSSQGLKTFLSLSGRQAVLSIETLASKCAWGYRDFLICAVPNILPRGSEGLPDDWFQGRVSFEDELMLVNAKTAEISHLYSFNTKENLSFDVTKLSTSRDNTLIAFNRKQIPATTSRAIITSDLAFGATKNTS